MNRSPSKIDFHDAQATSSIIASRRNPAVQPLTDLFDSSTPTHRRLLDQISWYDRKSQWNKTAHLYTSGLVLIAGALIPVTASIESARFLTMALGVIVVICQGLEHLLQFRANWIAYRSTAESLKHHAWLYSASANPYNVESKVQVLAENIEELVSTEHAKWIRRGQKQESQAQKNNSN